MANIFDKFDAQINPNELREKIKESAENSYEEVPAGEYIAKIEKMELGTTKDQSNPRPMFKVQMRLVEACHEGEAEETYLAKYKKKKPCVFMNRVIFGTKNDAGMIASVEGWLNKIFPDEPVVFTTYSQFAEDILDCAEACEGLEFAIDYDPKAFNSISITEVYAV